MREKYKNWWKFKSFLLQVSPPLYSKYPLIDKIYLHYNLMEHYISLFLQKVIKNVVKGLILLEV
jgi:hypothetical protein